MQFYSMTETFFIPRALAGRVYTRVFEHGRASDAGDATGIGELRYFDLQFKDTVVPGDRGQVNNPFWCFK